MQIFSKQVSREVAESLWQQREQFLKNGRPRSQKLIMTAFFSDLRGFTTVSEKMDPQDLMDWLNIYMERMTGIIMAHGGIIDDFAGDGIKANFGLPLPEQNESVIRGDALSAVRSALDMEQEMHHLNAHWQEKGLPEVGMRIGIYTGPAVAGALGSSQRMKYTTIGDTILRRGELPTKIWARGPVPNSDRRIDPPISGTGVPDRADRRSELEGQGRKDCHLSGAGRRVLTQPSTRR
jgi:adenylate cyclase